MTLDVSHFIKTGERRYITLETQVRREARLCAQSDYFKGLSCDPARHGAQSDSAWSSWYNVGFDELRKDKTDA